MASKCEFIAVIVGSFDPVTGDPDMLYEMMFTYINFVGQHLTYWITDPLFEETNMVGINSCLGSALNSPVGCDF